MCARPVALCLGLLLGCARPADEVIETYFEFEFKNAPMCTGTVDGRPANIDTLIATVYEFTGACDRCAGDPRCREVKRVCRCGPPRLLSKEALREATSGWRIEDVQASARYCIWLHALERNVTPQLTRDGDCACDAAWLSSDSLRMRGRVCARASGMGVNTGEIDFDVSCLDDPPRDAPPVRPIDKCQAQLP